MRFAVTHRNVCSLTIFFKLSFKKGPQILGDFFKHYTFQIFPKVKIGRIEIWGSQKPQIFLN